MKTPENLADSPQGGVSATIGTAEHSSPAVAAWPRAVPVTGWLTRIQMPIGT